MGTIQGFTLPLQASQLGPALASLIPSPLTPTTLFAIRHLGVFLSFPQLEIWRSGRGRHAQKVLGKSGRVGPGTPGLNVPAGAANPLSPPSCCPPDRGTCCATLELGRGAATISTEGYSPTPGLEWPPRGEARLQGAWKRDRGCLFSCLSWRRLPYWGPVFLELKHTALSPHRAVTFSKQDFSVGGLRGKPPSGRQQASPLARDPWRHRPWTATLSEHVSLVCLWFCVRQRPCVPEADSSTISLGHLKRSILESNPGMDSTEESFVGAGG